MGPGDETSYILLVTYESIIVQSVATLPAALLHYTTYAFLFTKEVKLYHMCILQDLLGGVYSHEDHPISSANECNYYLLVLGYLWSTSVEEPLYIPIGIVAAVGWFVCKPTS